MSGQQTPDEGLQDIIADIEQNVMEARDRIGTGDQSSEELQRAITRITQGRTGLINHIRRHMPEALEGEWIQELEENKHTDEEPRERDIEAVRASLRSLAVHAKRVRGDIEQLQQGIREIIDSSKMLRRNWGSEKVVSPRINS
jgi:phage shock protein A